MLHAVLSDEAGEHGDGFVFLPLPVRGIHDRRVEHLARAVHDRHLAAHAVARVEAHRHLALDRRLHQKGLQVERKLADGSLVGPLGEKGAHLALERGIDKAVVGVLSGGFDELHRSGAGLHHGAAQQRQRQLALEQDGRAEHFLFFAAVDGEDLVALQTGERLLKIVVQAVDAVLLRRGERAQRSALFQHLAQRAADGGIVADPLGDDVVRALQGVGERFHALFRVDKIARGVFGAGTAALLRKEQRRKRLKPLLPRNRRAGAALLLIGAVEVFDLGKRFGIVDGGGEFVCKLALLVDGFFHCLAPLFKATQVL